MHKSSSLRFTIYSALLFSIVCLIACSSNKVQMEKSAFDGKTNLTMNDIILTIDGANLTFNRPKTTLSLNWNNSMPKDSSLAKITLFGTYKNSDNTAININVDGEKFQFKIIDINKMSNVTINSKTSTTLGRVEDKQYYTETENTLELYSYIPDNVITKIATSNEASPLTINLANNVRVESSIKWFYKNVLADFINKKGSLKGENTSTIISKKDIMDSTPKTKEEKTIEPNTSIPLISIEEKKLESKQEPNEILPSESKVSKTLVVIITANIRSESNAKSKIIATLKKGTKVEYLGKSGNWFNVKLSTGVTGWVSNSLVTDEK
jgi:hypothetical protein